MWRCNARMRIEDGPATVVDCDRNLRIVGVRVDEQFDRTSRFCHSHHH
jgi:hypothetical protein